MTLNKHGDRHAAQPQAGGEGRKTGLSGFDPELLYVECLRCGSPVLWEPGRSTALVRKAGLTRARLDSGFVILTMGCPECAPGEISYETRVMPVSRAMVEGVEDEGIPEQSEVSGNA